MVRGVLAYLLAFACVQFTYGAHQFEHIAADAVESCDICLKTDRTDGLLDSTQTDEIAFDSPAISVDHNTANLAVRFNGPFRSRAPPVFS